MTAGSISRTKGVASGLTGAGAANWSAGTRRNLLLLLVASWMLPIQPILAEQRLDPYRLVLLVMFLPLLAGLITRKAGRFTLSDGLMLCFGGWVILTLLYHHGSAKFAYGAILAIELFAGYAAGRLLVRNAEDSRRMVKYALATLLVLLPFVVLELTTGRMLITEILGKAFPATEKFSQLRYGFSRVQGVFPHSILFGLYCSIHAANVYYIYRQHLMRVAPRLGMVVFMTMASLSSAPMLAVVVRAMTVLWGKLADNRWMLLVWLGVAGIVFLEFASNRGPVIILIETVTLDPQTGWWRYYIWLYGIESVKAAPLVGIGLNDWARPYWMAPASVDNFWLLIAMRHGVPGIALLASAIGVHIWRVTRVSTLSDGAQNLRTGYMIGLAGLCFTLATVHVWDVLAVYVMFYFGAGSFLYTSDTAATPTTPIPPAASRPPVVYARSFSAPVSKDQK